MARLVWEEAAIKWPKPMKFTTTMILARPLMADSPFLIRWTHAATITLHKRKMRSRLGADEVCCVLSYSCSRSRLLWIIYKLTAVILLVVSRSSSLIW